MLFYLKINTNTKISTENNIFLAICKYKQFKNLIFTWFNILEIDEVCKGLFCDKCGCYLK